MRCASTVIAFSVSSALLIAQAQVQQPAPADGPRFEVASIKRNLSGSGSMSVGGPPGRWVAVNATPLTVVMNAYPHETFRILDAPGWMSSERYDITAVAGGEPNQERMQPMLRALLAERFNFLAHTEMRPMQTYALVLARADGQLGPQLKPWTVDCEELRKSGKTAVPQPRTVADYAIPPPCGMRGGRGVYAAGGTSLADFTYSLASELSAPVTDHTGLKGDFEIVLRWNPDPSLPGADPSLPSLFAAVQEQLGLKLEARREPAEVFVIDRVERPTPD